MLRIYDEAIKTPLLRIVWAAIFLAALMLYAATANRGVQWQDSGWQQWRIVTGQWEHPLGLALVHPLQYGLGRVATRLTFLEPAFAITLLSSLAAAVAIANLVGTLVILTRRLSPALIAGAALMLAHTFWQNATHTESYAIVAALLSAEWFCLARYATTSNGRYLLGLAFFNGLGLANHLLAGLATPVDMVVIAWAIRQKHLSVRDGIVACGLWLIGSAPYTILILYTLIQTHDLSGTIHSALFGKYAKQVLNTSFDIRKLAMAIGFVLYNFPGLTILLAAYALIARLTVPKAFTRAIKMQLLIYLLFVIRYSISDQYTFFFPVYMLLALLAGLGLDHLTALWPSSNSRVLLILACMTALWTPLVYLTICYVLENHGAVKTMVGNKPYRNGYRAFFIPWGIGETYAVDLNRRIKQLVGDDGLILVGDNMIRFGLLYAQAKGQIGPVTEIKPIRGDTPDLLNQSIEENYLLLKDYLRHHRPVVLVAPNKDRPPADFEDTRWLRVGDLYILTFTDEADAS